MACGGVEGKAAGQSMVIACSVPTLMFDLQQRQRSLTQPQLPPLTPRSSPHFRPLLCLHVLL